MAGNYMDAPADRIAWDRDGSVAVSLMGGTTTLVTASDRRVMNSESEQGVVLPTSNSLAVLFPMPMDLVSVFFAAVISVGDALWRIETSKDTTNGLDGTWETQFQTGFTAERPVKPNYRQANEQYTLQDNSPSSDLRGIRFIAYRPTNINVFTATIRALHLYGTPSQTATKDRLAFWHPTTDTKLPPYYFDWGNVPRSTSADRTFRLKNLSLTRNATDIDLYVEALTQGNPFVDGMHTFSMDGGSTFLTGLVLPFLAPGEVSDPIIVRRTVPANAQVSVWSARIAADVNLWETA